jgi:Ino eighty subunit 1
MALATLSEMPFWQNKGVQADFLREVFNNDDRVFSNSYNPGIERQCFADLYIDAMQQGSKASQNLRDTLLSDRKAAKEIAMVCLFANLAGMEPASNCKLSKAAAENSRR